MVFFDWLYKVNYHCTDNRIMLYKHDKHPNDVAYQSWPKINEVRIATKEEIKNKRRDNLDV